MKEGWKEGWKEVSLGEVCKFNLRNLKKDFSYTKICYLDISSVGTGEAKFDNIININDAPSRAKRIPTRGDSIIATVRPGNRSFYYMNEFPPNTVVSTGFSILSPIDKDLDSRFLYYIISNQQFTQYLISVEQGANYPAVTASDISEAKIILPPLPTQRKIASILSGYDDLIENNLKRIKLLEEKAQRTYEEWFVKMRFPGYETAVFDEVTGLPEGWEKVAFGDFVKTSSGGTPSRKKEIEYYEGGTIPWVRTGELKNFILIDSEERITPAGLKGSSAKLFPKNTVLLAMYGNTIGETSFVTFETSTNQACCGFLVEEKGYLSYFIHQYLLNNKEQILSHRMGAAQENISQTIIQNIKINLPSQNLLIEFAELVGQDYKMIEILLNQNRLLKEARDILLPRLMSGMIDVEDMEITVMD